MKHPTTPAELDQLVQETIRLLEPAGAAKPLAGVRATAFTTSSEWLGELRRAVTEIRKTANLDPEAKRNLALIAKVAERAWR